MECAIRLIVRSAQMQLLPFLLLQSADPLSCGQAPTTLEISHYKLGLHQISYPAAAEIRPNFHIRPRPDMAARYEVGFDHLSMHLPHWVIGQEFIVLQIR